MEKTATADEKPEAGGVSWGWKGFQRPPDRLVFGLFFSIQEVESYEANGCVLVFTNK